MFAIAGLAMLAPSALAARDIPVGVHNLNGARGQDGPNRIWAMRFVIDHDTKLDRLFTGFNCEGVYTDHSNNPAPTELRTKLKDKGYGSPAAPSNLPAGWTTGNGRIDYGHGNGGEIRARLVTMKADGTPNLGNVLAEDTFYPVERFKATKAEFKIGDRAGMLYARFGGVALKAGTPYWVIYQNIDPNPRMNFVSYNSPVIKDSESGPNGRNTLDPNASGAIMGLDPREVVAWTWDSGSTWKWGREVGGGGPWIPGDYVGSTTSDDGTRLPWYAWQESGSSKLQSNQPFMSYPDSSGSYTVRYMNAPRSTTLTNAGGYAPIGSNIGIVTVRNTRTGQTGRTAALGSGIKRGNLDNPVAIAKGDTYEVSNSGTVWKAQGDNFLLSMGIVGPAAISAQTVGQNNDMAQLFAGPHPYYEDGGATPPTTTEPPPPTTTEPPPTTTTPPPTTPPPPPPPAPSTDIAFDSFARSASNGWGVADSGGTWAVLAGSASSFSTDGTRGVIAAPSSFAEQLIHLSGTSIRDVDVHTQLALSSRVTGSGIVYAYLVLRRQSSGAYYRVGAFVDKSGQVMLRGQDSYGGALFSDKSTGITLSAGESLQLRVQAQGVSPTTLRVKAWKTGSAEPGSWTLTATNSAKAVQAAGTTGLRVISNASNAPKVLVDDFGVSAIG